MGDVRASGWALVLLGSLAFWTSNAWGQACRPVVYVFRHAEDTLLNPPLPKPPPSPPELFALTPPGKKHAELYPDMIRGFAAVQQHCPVTHVYSTTKEPKLSTPDPCSPNCTSATNAFDTATPSARAFMSPSSEPITVVFNPAGVQYRLYEFLGNSNGKEAPPEDKTDYSTDVARALREVLLANVRRGESSAIFWTSEGLHVLGGAIFGATSNVPRKERGVYTPPRNAVYVFMPSSDGQSFGDTPGPFPASRYVQCFNHVEAEPHVFPNPGFLPEGTYACGFGSIQSNLDGEPPSTCPSCLFTNPPTCQAECGKISRDDIPRIKGKICDTTALVPGTRTATTYGQCE